MQKGLELFGVEIEKEGKKVKEVKKKKRKGTITISYGYYSTDIPEKIKKGDRFVSVDFEGYNEGSASPMKEEEVEDYVRQLYLKKSEDYKIEIIDKRKEQLKEREKFKDLKAKITIENYYTSDYNRISSLINKIVAKEIVEVSIREFLNKVRPKNNVEIDLALSYFLRRFKRKIKFTSQDIDILRANAFIPKSSNTTEDLNKNVKRGHLRREKINGKNMYSITQSGIEHIEKMEEVIK